MFMSNAPLKILSSPKINGFPKPYAFSICTLPQLKSKLGKTNFQNLAIFFLKKNELNFGCEQLQRANCMVGQSLNCGAIYQLSSL